MGYGTTLATTITSVDHTDTSVTVEWADAHESHYPLRDQADSDATHDHAEHHRFSPKVRPDGMCSSANQSLEMATSAAANAGVPRVGGGDVRLLKEPGARRRGEQHAALINLTVSLAVIYKWLVQLSPKPTGPESVTHAR